MSLLDGGGAALLSSIFAPLYLPGSIINVTTVYDEVGEPTLTETTSDARVQVDAMTESMRAQEGASDEDRRIIVLAPAILDTDAIIAVNGGPYAGSRWLVMAIDRDPVAAYTQCRARRKPD
jgi:hypothetical protein